MNKNTLNFDAVIFDMDGIITKTALVHAASWKQTFDEYLKLREKRDGEPFREFTREGDYLPYVDGKPRYKGVESFLLSRGITLEQGDPQDEPGKETICGIGNRKNDVFNEILASQGVEVYPSTIELIKKLRGMGVKTAVASSSKNCRKVLEAAKISGLFDTRVDGKSLTELGLKGKPEGDMFTTAAANTGAIPIKSVIVEDAISGVEAGRNGSFGLVIGVARESHPQDMFRYGADVVVNDLSEISVEWIQNWMQRRPLPLQQCWESIPAQDHPINTNNIYSRPAKEALRGEKRPVFFLDYDGTLTPIVSRPDLAVISTQMRDTLKALMQKYTVAVVSGRMREDVEKLVGIEGIFYAGSHGFDIKGPDFALIEPRVKNIIPTVDKCIAFLKQELSHIDGVLIEEKKFSTAVHYRLVDEAKHLDKIKAVVDKVLAGNKELRLLSGKKVFEILPAIDWNKGKAVRWIMHAMGLSWDDVNAVYIGDDTTDEYAFAAIRTRGTGILVSDKAIPSLAHFRLESPDDVQTLFQKLAKEG